jgi:F-type H+-transporting ATPase subunit epsilon
MNTFVIHLQSAIQYEQIEKVVSFVGEDDSGSFGILSGHGRMMTLLAFGLARFRLINQDWEFLAFPGAVAYFADGQLYLSTRRYLRGADYEHLSIALRDELLAEEEALRETKLSVRRLEEEMFRRLSKVKPSGELSR